MNKTLSAAALVLLMAVTACVTEKLGAGDDTLRGEGLVVRFKVGGTDSFATKSKMKKSAKQLASAPITCKTIALCEPDDPDQVFLTVTAQRLDDVYGSTKAVTKGAPIYTETFVDNFPDIIGYPYAVGSGTPEPFAGGSKLFGCIDKTNRIYAYDFGASEWPEGKDLLFFLAAPTTLDGVTTTDIDGNKDFTRTIVEDSQIGYNGVIEFDYASPAEAADQKDIVFTSRNLSEDEYWSKDNSDSRILFYHTLAGVKFKSKSAETEAAANSEVLTNLTSVKITNIRSTGHCKVVPTYDQEGYNDTDSNTDYNTDKDVSKSREVVAWTKVMDVEGNLKDYSLSGLGLVDNDQSVTGFPDHFGGADGALGRYNINKEDFSETFMFIPQTTNDASEITITYTLSNHEGEVFTKTVSFAGQEWEPGVLYTYSLSAKHVDLNIWDKIADDGGKEVKKDLTIRNTGNVDVYFRVAIVGNWMDLNKHPQIVYPWNQNNASEGHFTGLDTVNNWILEEDGFYYYKYKVKPGQAIEDPLFTSYEVGTCPLELYQNSGRLQLDIMTQSFDASQKSRMKAFGWKTDNLIDDYKE